MPTPQDTLISFGSAVKALGNGRVGGHLVLFSGPNDPDLTGQFFTKDTDFWQPEGKPYPTLYHHGFDETLDLRRLGTTTIKMDAAGLWAEAQLDLRDEYERKIYAMVEEGKLGWSSGSAPHMVRVKKVGTAEQILSWPIVEATLTPTPAEYRARVVPLKALISEPHMPDPTKVLSEGSLDESPDAKPRKLTERESASAAKTDGDAIKVGMHVKAGVMCGMVKSVHTSGKPKDSDDKEYEASEDEPMVKVDLHDDDHKPTGTIKIYKSKQLAAHEDQPAEDKTVKDDDDDEAVMSAAKVIRKVGDKYELRTHDGKRVLGTHDTREEAEAQERAIEAAKHPEKSATPSDNNKKSADTKSLRAAVMAPVIAEIESATKAVTSRLLGDTDDAMTFAALCRLHDIFCCFIWCTLADERVPLDDQLEAVEKAFDEYRDTALRVIRALQETDLEEDAERAAMKFAPSHWLGSLKSLSNLQTTGNSAATAPFAAHSQQVVSAVGEFVRRSEDRSSARVKAGRELSEANRSEIDAVCTALESGVEKLRKILDRTQAKVKEPAESEKPETAKSVGTNLNTPAVSPAELLQLEASLLRLQADL